MINKCCQLPDLCSQHFARFTQLSYNPLAWCSFVASRPKASDAGISRSRAFVFG